MLSWAKLRHKRFPCEKAGYPANRTSLSSCWRNTSLCSAPLIQAPLEPSLASHSIREVRFCKREVVGWERARRRYGGRGNTLCSASSRAWNVKRRNTSCVPPHIPLEPVFVPLASPSRSKPGGSAITRSDAFAVVVAKLGFNPLS